MQEEIGKNVSSGAEKVEEIARDRVKEQQRAAEAAERAAAEARIGAAKAEAAQKQADAAARQAQKQRAKKERAARKEQAEKKRAAERAQKEQARAEKKKRPRGIGGWIAAVVSLGAACLALATVVATGTVRMNGMQRQAENACRATLYELVAVSEALDDDLNKLRVSAGAGEQRMLLTEVLVNSALMESALEKLPVVGETGAELSAFINHTNGYARRMLAKLAAGQPLTAREQAAAARLCTANAALAHTLNALAVQPSSFMRFFGGSAEALDGWRDEMRAARKEENAPRPWEKNVEEDNVKKRAKVSAAEAEEKLLDFFSGYHVADVRLTGETHARGMTCYDFTVTDENGAEIFAQVTEHGGDVAFFESYGACGAVNFDLGACEAIAREFLLARGFEDMAAVWQSDTGTAACVTYVTVRDGVYCYPDMVQVRVCKETGRVTGMNARGYLFNHENARGELSPTLGEGEARQKLSDALTVEASRLALLPVRGREVLCYEFACKSGEEGYLVFLDAATGDEVCIYRIHDGAHGRYLR